jgi:drug/metabolite transporter (DMT)-like permease
MSFHDTALGRHVARMPANLRGMAAMFASAGTISSMNGVVHHLVLSMHAFEIAFFRQLFGLIFIAVVFLRDGLQPLYTRKFKLHAARALFNVIALLSYFVALSLEPLAKVVGLGFTAPLFATLGAAFFLGETMGVRRWLALVVGLGGALIIVRPGVEAGSFGTMMVLLSNAAWACALIVIKVLARTESAVTITAYAAMLMVPMALATAVFVWQWPTIEQIYWLIGIGVFGTFAQLCLSQAFREADAVLVLPVDFTKFIWVSVIGYFFFAEVPEMWTVVGAAVICSGVFYNAYRERTSAP